MKKAIAIILLSYSFCHGQYNTRREFKNFKGNFSNKQSFCKSLLNSFTSDLQNVRVVDFKSIEKLPNTYIRGMGEVVIYRAKLSDKLPEVTPKKCYIITYKNKATLLLVVKLPTEMYCLFPLKSGKMSVFSSKTFKKPFAPPRC